MKRLWLIAALFALLFLSEAGHRVDASRDWKASCRSLNTHECFLTKLWAPSHRDGWGKIDRELHIFEFGERKTPLGVQLAFWQSRDSNYNKVIVASGGYQGPGNITATFVVWYSCAQAYNAAYAVPGTNPACDIVDTATGLASCTIPIGTNGSANLTAIVCPTSAPTVGVTTFCTVTHAGCSVSQMYDQTGNSVPVLQATLANMPILTLNALNSLPCPTNSSSALSSSANIPTANQPFSGSLVAKTTGGGADTGILGNGAFGMTRHGTNSWGAYQGTVASVTASDGAFHAMQFLANNTTSDIQIDSTLTTGLAVGAAGAGARIAGVLTRTGSPVAGTFCEGGYSTGDQSGNFTALNSNQHTRYGF